MSNARGLSVRENSHRIDFLLESLRSFPSIVTLRIHRFWSILVAMASSEPSAAESHGNGPLFSLENILGDEHEKLEHPHIKPEGWDEEEIEREVAHGYCIECEGA
jgi:hypothetical protein